jgi:peptide/nickel transport system substrate-binding protein
MKKTLTLAVLCLAAGGARAEDDKTFVAATANMPQSLDPAALYERQALMISLNIYDTLLRFSGESFSEFVPALSEAVPSRENGLVSEDGLTYTFPLRKGVRFHDGTPMTAEDARYSLLRFMLMDFPGGPGHLFLQPILGVDRVRGEDGKFLVDFQKASEAVQAKDGALVIRLDKPFRPFLSLAASWPFVTSKAWAASKGEWDGSAEAWQSFHLSPRSGGLRFAENGTGPYRLSSVDEANDVVTLERNQDYWGAPGTVDKAVFTAFSAEDYRLKQLALGKVDYAEITHPSVGDARRIPGVTVLDELPNYTTGKMAVFSLRVDPKDNKALGSGRLDGRGIPPDFFSDPGVRKGVAFAFDYEGYNQEMLDGKSRRVYGPVPFLPKVKTAYNFDPAKAAEFFKQAYRGEVWKKGFLAEIAYNETDNEASELADYLTRNLLQLNPKFVLKPKPLHPDLLREERKSRLPIYVNHFGPDYIDFNTYAFNLMHSQGLFPRMQGYSNPEADRLVREAMNARTKEERLAFYEKLQDVYTQDIPQMFTAAAHFCKAFRAGIGGMEPRRDAFGAHNFIDLTRVRKGPAK